MERRWWNWKVDAALSSQHLESWLKRETEREMRDFFWVKLGFLKEDNLTWEKLGWRWRWRWGYLDLFFHYKSNRVEWREKKRRISFAKTVLLWKKGWYRNPTLTRKLIRYFPAHSSTHQVITNLASWLIL